MVTFSSVRQRASAALPSGKKLTGIYTRGKTFWFTYRINGIKRYHSLKTKDYREAVQRALQIRAMPETEPIESFDREIESFVAAKLNRDEYSRDSASNKPYALRDFAAFVDKPPHLVTVADCQAYYLHQRARVAESTAQSYVTTIRSFYNWMIQTKKLRDNPVDGIELARLEQKGRLVFCDRGLRDRLIRNCDRLDLKFILFCGFHAGMRKNEIVEARPEWFNLDRRTIEICETETFRPKDREARTVPLSKDFAKFLKRYRLQSPFMLHPEIPHGLNRYRYDFRRPFAEYMEAQGCSWVTPHVMRHTFASLFAIAGVSLYKIAKWLGDGNRVVERYYAKLAPVDIDFERAFSKEGRLKERGG